MAINHLPARGKSKVLRSPVKQERVDGSPLLSACPPLQVSRSPFKGEQKPLILQHQLNLQGNCHIGRDALPLGCLWRSCSLQVKTKPRRGDTRLLWRRCRTARCWRTQQARNGHRCSCWVRARPSSLTKVGLQTWMHYSHTWNDIWLVFFVSNSCTSQCQRREAYPQTGRSRLKAGQHFYWRVRDGGIVSIPSSEHSQVLTFWKLRSNVLFFFFLIRELKMGKYSMSRIFSREQPNLHQVRTISVRLMGYTIGYTSFILVYTKTFNSGPSVLPIML